MDSGFRLAVASAHLYEKAGKSHKPEHRISDFLKNEICGHTRCDFAIWVVTAIRATVPVVQALMTFAMFLAGQAREGANRSTGCSFHSSALASDPQTPRRS